MLVLAYSPCFHFCQHVYQYGHYRDLFSVLLQVTQGHSHYPLCFLCTLSVLLTFIQCWYIVTHWLLSFFTKNSRLTYFPDISRSIKVKVIGMCMYNSHSSILQVILNLMMYYLCLLGFCHGLVDFKQTKSYINGRLWLSVFVVVMFYIMSL